MYLDVQEEFTSLNNWIAQFSWYLSYVIELKKIL